MGFWWKECSKHLSQNWHISAGILRGNARLWRTILNGGFPSNKLDGYGNHWPTWHVWPQRYLEMRSEVSTFQVIQMDHAMITIWSAGSRWFRLTSSAKVSKVQTRCRPGPVAWCAWRTWDFPGCHAVGCETSGIGISRHFVAPWKRTSVGTTSNTPINFKTGINIAKTHGKTLTSTPKIPKKRNPGYQKIFNW